MRLPRFEGQRPKVSREMLSSRGLNWTNDYIDGDLENCDRITGAELPYLRTDGTGLRARAFPERFRGVASADAGVDFLLMGKTVFRGIRGGFNEHYSSLDPVLEDINESISISRENLAVFELAVVGDFLCIAGGTDINRIFPIGDSYRLGSRMLHYEETRGAWPGGTPTVWVKDSEQNRLYFGDPRQSYSEEEVEAIDESWAWVGEIMGPGDRVTLRLRGNNGFFLEGQSVVVQSEKVANGVFSFEDALPIDPKAFVDGVAVYTEIQFKRDYPRLKYICHHDNRLFGVDDTGTIYASALGQPQNMEQFQSLSTDSFVVGTGEKRHFTGCCELLDGVFFFTDQAVYKLVGDTPDTFSLYKYLIPGVKAGCHRSISAYNQTIFYVGNDGVYRYDGSTQAVCISKALGEIDFRNCVGCAYGPVYLLYYAHNLYTYWIDTGVWLRRSEEHRVEALYPYEHGVLSLEGASPQPSLEAETRDRGFAGAVWSFKWASGDSDTEDEAGVPWSLEFKPFREETMGKKGPSRLLLRLALTRGSWCRILLKEGPGEWKEIRLLREIGPDEALEQKERVEEVRIAPGRCDVFRVRLEGEGSCRVLGIQRETIIGGVR